MCEEEADARGVRARAGIAPITAAIPYLDGTQQRLLSQAPVSGGMSARARTLPHHIPPRQASRLLAAHALLLHLRLPPHQLCSMRCVQLAVPHNSTHIIPSIPNPRGGLPAMPRICTVSARVGARRKTCRSMMMVLCLWLGERGMKQGERRVSPPALFDVCPPH